MHEADAVPMSDEELVRRVRAGDEAAARELFERHDAGLRARVRRKLPAAVRAKVAVSDVVQEARLAAYRSLAAFDDRGGGSFARWLQEIADHKVLDETRRFVGTQRRAPARETALSRADELPAARTAAPTPSAVAMSAEERAALRAAMATLSADHQEILRLVHQDGRRLVEAAQVMGRSPDAVRMLYGRAVAALLGRMNAGPIAR